MNWFLFILTVLSLFSSIVGWIAKIRWSKEFKEAKEAQITTLKERIEHYKSIASTELLNYFEESKIHYERNLNEARNKLKEEREKNREGHSSEEEYKNTIEELINEKETLLEEVHHRVKNNLAIINGLIELQSFDSADKNFKQETLKLRNKIRSIAIVHEAIYLSDHINKINLHSLVLKLIELYGFDLEIEHKDEITLDINQAIPLSLLINEFFDQLELLGANSIVINYSLNEGKVSLNILNGILEYNKVFQDQESLGFALSNTLLDQLNGTLTLEDKISLHFKKNPTSP